MKTKAEAWDTLESRVYEELGDPDQALFTSPLLAAHPFIDLQKARKKKAGHISAKIRKMHHNLTTRRRVAEVLFEHGQTMNKHLAERRATIARWFAQIDPSAQRSLSSSIRSIRQQPGL